MEQYIPKSAIVEEIERRIKKYATIDVGDYKELEAIYGAKCKALTEILSFLNTLEVKEIVDLQGIEKEVADNRVSRLDSKRIPITLKGELKGKFLNEFNTLWQTVGKLQFANVAKAIIERMCLHFAAWGSYNLRDYIKINAEESSNLDTLEVKEVDLEKEVNEAWNYIFSRGWDENSRMALKHDEYMAFAKHFFELGLNARKEDK